MEHKNQMSSSTSDAPATSTPSKTTAAVLTVSDSCSRGEKVDLSGPAVVEALARHNFQIVARYIIADDIATIQQKLTELCRSARLVATTGGTGIVMPCGPLSVHRAHANVYEKESTSTIA